MDNKTYLDTLVMTGKASEINGFEDIYETLSMCNIDIEKIGNIGLKHEAHFEYTLHILRLIVKNSMDVEVIDSCFNEIYRIYKVYDKYMIDAKFNAMVRKIMYDIKNFGEPFGCDDIKILFRRLRLREIYGSEYQIKINNKLSILKRYDEKDRGEVYFSIDDKEDLYSMLVDYEGETVLYPKWVAPSSYMKLKKIKELGVDKIDMLVMFYDEHLDLGKGLSNDRWQ